MNKRLKILLSAYACEPEKGSEPGVGWSWLQQISRFHDVWVITRENNRLLIEKELKRKPLNNVCWIYYDLPLWLKFWKKGNRGVYLYYYLWQFFIYFLGRNLYNNIHFDIIHHVTFVNYWTPSFLSFLPVPFVWGPVGGGEVTPEIFYNTFSFKGKICEYLRHIAQWTGAHEPFTLHTARKSCIALATTKETENKLKQMKCRNTKILSQVGLNEEEFDKLASLKLRQSLPFRLLSIGNLLHWKGFHIGLKAFKRLLVKFPTSEYWIIGKGPELNNLKGLCRKLGIEERTIFLGKIKREAVMKKLEECDVLIHPSFHDSGGYVCAEAMAGGRPVICLDLGGPAVQITEETGFKIPAINPEQVINDTAEAMITLATNSELRISMAKAGRKRIKEFFLWEKKGDYINKIYQELINQNIT